MKILLIEPYWGDSHAYWAKTLSRLSCHEFHILKMKDSFWKWRMQGSCVTLGQEFLESDFVPDLILASDMLHLPSFLAITRKKTAHLPVVLYFHENQLSYPWSPKDRDKAKNRDHHYPYINYLSALVSDQIWFNSDYHKSIFFESLPPFLKSFPDHQEVRHVKNLKEKSKVLPIPVDLDSLKKNKTSKADLKEGPIILWNHRWEHDKNPEGFFQALVLAQEAGLQFRLAVCGASTSPEPPLFDEMKKRFSRSIIHWGYCSTKEEYLKLLWTSHLLPVTSYHDFFGLSVIEALYCGLHPLLPRRLAYPEHLEEKDWDQYLYEDQEDLEKRLLNLLSHPEKIKGPVLGKIMQYEAQSVVHRYDQCFQGMVHEF